MQVHTASATNLIFRLDTSTNLVDWLPYVEGMTRNEAPFEIEVPTNQVRQAFYRVEELPGLSLLLKPMLYIPEGTFLMGQGGPYASHLGLPVAGPVHEVTLSPFRMDACEVTLQEWQRVLSWATNALRGSNVYTFVHSGSGQGPDHPVGAIDWYDTVKWANAGSEMEGLTPVYYTDASLTQIYRSGLLDIRNDYVAGEGDGYRLPTEAEWEYASRGGLSQKIYPWGDEHPDETRANFVFLFEDTTPVGQFPPNQYGLFDLAGNVREWCWDLHKDDPSVSYTNHVVFAPYDPWPQTNPRGPYTGPRGMARGGGFIDTHHYIQCGRRHNDERYRITSFTGFRLVKRTPP